MSSVNETFLRWKASVSEYIFTSPGFNRNERQHLSKDEFQTKIDLCVRAPVGETDARKRAAELGSTWLASSDTDKKVFFKLLAEEFGPDRQRIDTEIENYRTAVASGRDNVSTSYLRDALKPRRMALFTRFTSLPDGLKFLVDMREELLGYLRDDPALKSLDNDLRDLFRLWFDQGFLEIHRVTWHSPAALLEKLMEYEAIHSIISWQDLKNRLDRDRRCYTLFHPRMREEPLGILHVALTDDLATNVQTLLQEDTPPLPSTDANTAIFYSVTSTQQGLKGISFGEFLIKEAVGKLQRELPHLEKFATLSPIPGFRNWLMDNISSDDFKKMPFAPESLEEALHKIASGAEPVWRPEIEKILLRKCLQYLTTTKDGKPINPVARFHLRNGAFIEKINFMGDTSSNGLRNAAGMMVNYGYDLKNLESNLVKNQEGKLVVESKLLKSARADKLPIEHLVSAG